MYKKVILLGAVAVAAGLFWFWVKPWVASPTRFSDTGVWLKPLITIGLLSSVLGLNFLLLKNKWLKILASAVSGLPFFAVFGFSQFYLGAFALLLLFHWYAIKNFDAESAERIKINIRASMQRGLPRVITPYLILISFAFFFSSGVQASAAAKELPPTVRQVVEKTVGVFLGQEIQALPPQERKPAENKIVDQVLAQFNEFLGPYFKYFPPILAFGLFLVLQGLSFILVWLAVVISALLFWVLKIAGWVKIKILQKEAEELEF